MPGELLPFKKGAFHLAIQTGSAIVPVAIKNTDLMMGKKTGVAYPGTIEMMLCEPIETNDPNVDVMQLLMKSRNEVAAKLATDGSKERK